MKKSTEEKNKRKAVEWWVGGVKRKEGSEVK